MSLYGSTGSVGGIHKRTRAQVGKSNRKRPELVQQTQPAPVKATAAPQKSSPASPVLPEGRNSTIMQSTAASLGKLRPGGGGGGGGGTREGKEAKERKEAEKVQLEVLRCKFVETFEEGKNNLKTGMLYVNPDLPPTRFSPAPAPRDTFYLTTGEQGSPSYITEDQRLATTYHTNIHPKKPEIVDVVVDDNAVRKAQTKGQEEGRLARIRANNARVDASNDEFHQRLEHEDNRRVHTVKKQQEGYAQAIAVRQARGLN